MKGGLKKGKWSKEEDNLIKNHIEKHGIGRSWQGLSNTLGLKRCGRSCRSRWLNYLRPGLKHGNFTPAEDRVIYEMYSKKGSCWSVIAAKLPGRTDLAIKNYWNSTLKKRFPRAARSRRLRHRRTGSTSSDDTASADLALVAYDEESISPTALVVYNEEDSASTPPVLQLVVYNEAGYSSSHACAVSAGSPMQLPPPPLAIAAANEEPISGPVRMEPWTPPPPADDTSEEMDVDCGPMSPVPLGLMEPDLPRIAMEPDLPCITMGLPNTAGFDDIDSFLCFFHH
ncbi:hypothetical protein QYE76_011845 [Lolium multiflorum]|uniref:Uncharacterized protein n=1 Tax=Lolium multiflorum TaxID=4521 RepID=A0AAD8X344_LOLMU|nr:hypothetical protein QYE76_011845 [Lolium multiflorum]